MRIPRLRVFDITIDGLPGRRENAWNRVVEEVQHDLSLEHPGCFVRVVEKYIGGSKARPVDKDMEADE